MSMKKLFIGALMAGVAFGATAASAQVTTSKDRILYYTKDWTGERFPDGRPKIPDDVIRRAANMTVEDLYDELRTAGYGNQYEDHWQILHADKPMVGRAMTTQYVPSRPDIAAAARAEGQAAGLTNLSNNGWPISMLQEGDVWVVDGFGKIQDGTVIGSNLGSAIASKTKTGFVFDSAIRDEAENKEHPNFNGWYRAERPEAWSQMQLLSINAPIHIGKATVVPGDLVVANSQGVTFVPAAIADRIVSHAEFTALKDEYNFSLNASGANGTTFEGGWDAKKYAGFSDWIKKNPAKMKMSQAMFQQLWTADQAPRPAAAGRGGRGGG
jgi:4-hydroxy-4-methyl-2-oxoglutarate aldolase